jgi:hypothetical protein
MIYEPKKGIERSVFFIIKRALSPSKSPFKINPVNMTNKVAGTLRVTINQIKNECFL